MGRGKEKSKGKKTKLFNASPRYVLKALLLTKVVQKDWILLLESHDFYLIYFSCVPHYFKYFFN